MTVFDHVWQSTLVAGSVYFLTLLFRENRPGIRYWLWFAASLKFLLPFSALAALGRLLLVQTLPAGSMAMLIQMRPVAMPFSAIAPAQQHFPWTGLLLVIWLLGVVLIATVWAIRWWRLSAGARTARLLAFDLPVPVRSAPSLLEPGLLGISQPVILLPEGIVDRLSAAEIDTILRHELSHWRRRDNLLALVHMLVECLFWFHPLVWFIGTRLVEERERACDEEVLRGGKNSLEYAQTILKVCQHYLRSPLACTAGISGADLNRRISAIMAHKDILEIDPGRKVLLVSLLGVMLMAPLVAGGLKSAPAVEMARRLASAMVPLAPRNEVVILAPAVPSARPIHAAARHPHYKPAMGGPIPAHENLLTPTPIDRALAVIIVPDVQLETEAQPSVGDAERKVCRAPQQLPQSRLSGPEVCLPQHEWDQINKQKLVLMPDGRTLAARFGERDAEQARPCYSAGSSGASSVTARPINCF